MSQYTSYYLYQKYEKRGDQDWIPCYPNEYSIDADGLAEKVVKKDVDALCGWVTGGTDDFTYEEWRETDDYICNDGAKYKKLRRYVSWDDRTYAATDVYKQGSLIAPNSFDCGWNNSYSAYTEWVWVDEGDTICVGTELHKYPRKYFKNSDDTYKVSDIYGIGSLTLQNCIACGYEYGNKVYRWTDVANEYLCGDCSIVEITPSAFVSETNDKTVGKFIVKNDNKNVLNGSDTYPFQNTMTHVRVYSVVTSLSSDTFQNSSLISIDLPNSVTEIKGWCFANCSITSLTIPSSVTTIDSYLCNRSNSLSLIQFGNAVTSIGDLISNSNTLYSVVITTKTPPTVRGSFYGNLDKIYVPNESVESYKTAWTEYADKIVSISERNEQV